MDEKLVVEVGSEAPDFTLPSSEGKLIPLSDYRNREYVALYFMREFSWMQCRQHVASLRRVYDYLQERDIAVLVVGGGSPKDAARLKATYKLPFPVLADKDRSVYAHYGLDKILFTFQRSATFLIDRQGVVRYIRRASSPSASLDQAELMREVEKLQKPDTSGS